MLIKTEKVIYCGIDLSPNKMAITFIDQDKNLLASFYYENVTKKATKKRPATDYLSCTNYWYDPIGYSVSGETIINIPSKENKTHLYLKADEYGKALVNIIETMSQKHNSRVKIIMEDYSDGSFGRGDDVRELTGIVILHLTKANISFVKLKPTSLKLKFTGFGGGGKEGIHYRVREILGYNLVNNDIEDSYALAYVLSSGEVTPKVKRKKAA